MLTTQALIVGGCAVGTSALTWALLARRVPRAARPLTDSLEGPSGPTPLPATVEDWEGMDRAPTITRLIARRPWTERLQVHLLRAGWVLRPSEFLLYAALGAVLLGGLLMLLLNATWMMPVGVVLGAILSWVLLLNAQTHRNQALSAQLPDVLDLLASAVRAGFSFSQGMSRAQAQMMPPITIEFGRCLEEVQLGRSLAAALENMVIRTGNYDLALIVSAVQTQLETGGNMAEMLGKIAALIRERVRLQGEINVASAEGRLSAVVLIALPVGLLFLLRVMSPAYLQPLFDTSLGHYILGGAAALMVLGAITLRRLIAIRV